MRKIICLGVVAASLNGQLGVAGESAPWFANLPASADPAAVSKRITDQLLSTSPSKYCPQGFKGLKWFGIDGNRIPYSVVSLWVNALECADRRGDTNAVERLIRLYDDYLPEGPKAQYRSRPYHVDDTIFGSLPYQIYLQNGDRRCLDEGNRYADTQWSEPSENTIRERHALPAETQWTYWKRGFSPQTRLWIDDMYMIIALQSQAYRATGDVKYINRAAQEMCLYLDELQLKEGPSRGLFYHAPDAKYVWGRGDGWMAAGMALVLRYLSEDNPHRARILEGYRLMMESLLRYQRADGKWCQLVDRPDDPRNWAESSCTAMFAYSFMMGVRFGWLPAETYGAAARKAWLALCGWLDEYGNLTDVCCGTGKENDLQYYFDRQRIVGDPHGQAPMLWCARALLEARTVTIHMAGDSTMARYDHGRDPYMFGWGERLQRLCRAGVRVSDCAASGRSLETFRKERRWERLLSAVNPGDFVVIQFGHNDEKFAYDYEGRKGIGAAASLKLYCDNLRSCIADVRKRAAHPVVVTSIVRLIPGKDGRLESRTTLRTYCDAAARVAGEARVPVVDLGEFSRIQMNAIGCVEAEKYYMLSAVPQKNDRSHLTLLGADAYAGWFASLVKVAGLPMAKMFLCADAAEDGASVRQAVEHAVRSGESVVELKRQTYRFEAADATLLRLFISNHDQEDVRRVNVPIVGATNLTVRGNGARLVFCGRSIPFAIIDSVGVRLENLSVDFDRPFLTEGEIVGFESGRTLLRIDPKTDPVEIREGRIRLCGAGWEYPVASAKLFDRRTRAIVERSGDISYDGAAVRRPDGLLSLAHDFSKSGRGGRVGDIVVLRPGPRPNPAIFIASSKDTALEDVSVHTALGMALLAQRSENVSWCGTERPEARRCGVFPSAGRSSSAHADASHFSNVRGSVRIENCLFEGMMDDAINVHSTCLMITNVVAANRIRCRYMHFQSVGFETFSPGERLRLIDGLRLENGPEAVVTAVDRLDARTIELTLDRPLPPGFGAGDAVENADFQPSVVFRGNIVRNNRARGALFTTPKPIVVESNLFERVAGSAILFAGDAHYWFESGACRDVLVRGNVFRDCLTNYGSHGFCEGILSFYPVVERPSEQVARYHRNIRIRDNVFETFDAPILYAASVDGLSFRDNEVRLNDHCRALGLPAFRVRDSTNVTIGCERAVPEDWLGHVVYVPSTADATAQPAYWFPPAASGKAPLLVGLHTWSYDLSGLFHYRAERAWCRRHGWAFIAPNCRGPNWLPQGCGSDLAVQDVVDAVSWAKAHASIDGDRVYIAGGSGGGHMTLLMAGRHPEIWAGCAAFCPIVDLAAWHEESKSLEDGYRLHLEAACGGTPLAKSAEYRRRSPLTFLAAAREAGVNVYIGTGIHDGHPKRGSVPVSHSLNAYNALAREADRLAPEDIAFICRTERLPRGLATEETDDPFYVGSNRIHLRRTSGNAGLTLFEGAHACNFPAAFEWLSRQRRGHSADWSKPVRSENSAAVEKLSR